MRQFMLKMLGFTAMTFVLGAVSLATDVRAQETPKTPPSRDSLLTVARSIIDSARIATFATLDESGAPRIRPMDPFAPDSDMTIWLGTTPNSRKVVEIAKHPTVAICYLDPRMTGYVTVYGTATLINDPKEKANRWKSEWEAFYKDRDKDYVLIRVKPTRIELLDFRLGLMADASTWRPLTIEFPR
jgi:general stress protein 26